MDWFLCDTDLRRERVKKETVDLLFLEAKETFIFWLRLLDDFKIKARLLFLEEHTDLYSIYRVTARS